MALTSSFDDPTALAFRVHALERNETTAAAKLERMDGTVGAHGELLAAQREQVSGLTNAVSKLNEQLTWVNRALIGLCLTIAGSAVGVMITLGAHP